MLWIIARAYNTPETLEGQSQGFCHPGRIPRIEAL